MNRRLVLKWVNLSLSIIALVCGFDQGRASALVPVPGGTPDYFGTTPNWAFSPPVRKFVDTLPGLGAAKANNLGQYIPVAVPDTVTYPGSDYYEIEMHQYTEKMHSDLPPTTLRGYVQTNSGTNSANCGGTGQPACTAVNNTIAPAPIRYMGPLIVAQKDRPVRVKFINKLPLGAGGQLFLPVDETVMGAGPGPEGGSYTQNRATAHLHGGKTPWISDGTPHQWITPAGESTNYPEGVSVRNVPDMPDPGDGSQTFFYSNQQSARLLFYHDHAYGITRLNVYAGMAAGYMIKDPTEQDLVARGIIPAEEIPLIIQDKTFVDAVTIGATDPTWNWGTTPPTPNTGDLWWPHVYVPAQNPYDVEGVNPTGRWHYGPWFWPPTLNVKSPPVPNPYYDPVNAPWEPPMMPGTPNPSWGAEAFMDTPVVNGTAFPSLTVDPKSYRFRILNAAHDRFFNLQLYKASSIVSGITVTSGGSGYTSAPVVTITGGGGGAGATAAAEIDETGAVTAVRLVSVGSGYTSAPAVSLTGGGGTGAAATAAVYTALTEVGMVPAVSGGNLPANWPADSREGGVPDPATVGPDWIQIGGDAGFLPAPTIVPNQPIAWNLNPTTFNFGNVSDHSLLLAPAERADVVVDFSRYAGQTLILYNDAPTAFPALDPRTDYYTGAPDLSAEGGHPGPQAGFGPNTRTLMQIKVAPTAVAPAFNLAALETEFASTGTRQGVFARGQDPINVGQSAYNSAYNIAFPTTWPNWGISRIQDTTLSFAPAGTGVASVLLTSGGTGYTSAPTVTLNGGGGTGATAVATVTGVVRTITVTNGGSGYSFVPNVIFSGGGGTGAAATATVTNGRVTGITITNPGSGYTSPPAVSFSDGTGVVTRAAATATITGAVNAINITAAGTNYTSAPIVTITGGGGTGAAATATLTLTLRMEPKAIQDEMGETFDEYGRMAAKLGLTVPVTVPGAAGFVLQNFVDPPSEIITDSMTPMTPVLGDGTQIWKITHNGVDTHPVHFHIFDVQLINRVGWDGAIRLPDANELGWKDTVRVSPLEDTIVALRPVAPKLPFGIPDSIRLLNPALPLGSTEGFSNLDPLNPGQRFNPPITNQLYNFGWEYVWHCHILSHEENDMMRAIKLNVARQLATAPVLSVSGTGPVNLAWTDATPAGNPATLGNPANEIGFRIERATGTTGAFSAIGQALANVTTYSDTTAASGTTYRYRVVAYNAAGDSTSNTVTVGGTPPAVPAVPTNLTAAITSATRIRLTWSDASTNETSFAVWRSVSGGQAVQIGSVARTSAQSSRTGTSVTFNDNAVTVGNSYSYYVTAVSAAGASAASNTASISFTPPSAPTNLTATAVISGNQRDRVTLNWTDTSSTETGFTIQRSANGIRWDNVTTTKANATTYTQNAVPRNTTFQYRIRANGTLGGSAWVVVSILTP